MENVLSSFGDVLKNRKKRRKKAGEIFNNPDEFNRRMQNIFNPGASVSSDHERETNISGSDDDVNFEASSNYGDAECRAPSWDVSSISSDSSSIQDDDLDIEEIFTKRQETEIRTKDAIIHPSLQISLQKSMEEVAAVACVHHCSNRLVEDILGLISSHLPADSNYPKTFYHFRKALSPNEKFYEVVFYCAKCWIELDPACYCLVVEQMTEMWIKCSCKQPYHIGQRLIEINERLYRGRVPCEISRAFKCITKRSEWKASEWRTWMFVVPVVLKGILSERHLKHFSKLTKAIHMLSKETIPWDEVAEAESFLHEFISEANELYGPLFYTYNVHQLSHLADHVRNWGPLWVLSIFNFESFNGELVKNISNINGLELQIAERFVRRLLLRKFEDKSKIKLNESAFLKNGKLTTLDGETQRLLSNYTFDTVYVSRCAVIRHHEFRVSDSRKRSDTIVAFKPNFVGKVRNFYDLKHLDKPDLPSFLVADVDAISVNKFPTQPQISYSRSPLMRRTIVPLNEILLEKFIYLPIDSTTYYVALPNLFESS